MAVIPETYQAWRHCIEVDCGIPLTSSFIDARIDVLSRSRNEETERFAALYGAAHHVRVLDWFRQARIDLHRR